MAEGFQTLPPVPLGLSVPPVVVAVGFLSLFAFWMGGAGSVGEAPEGGVTIWRPVWRPRRGR